METVSTPEQEHFKLIYLRGLEYKAPVLAHLCAIGARGAPFYNSIRTYSEVPIPGASFLLCIVAYPIIW